jgi:hypothetical protein
MTAAVRNRIKFALAGDAFEMVNPFIPGGPHAELVRRAGEAPISTALELCAGTGYASSPTPASRSTAGPGSS